MSQSKVRSDEAGVDQVGSNDGGRLGAGPAEDMIGYKLRMAQILAFRAFEEKMSTYGKAPRYLALLSVIRQNPGQS